MRTEMTHCNHFHAKTMRRKDTCPMLDKEYDGGDPWPSIYRFAECMGYTHTCPHYDDTEDGGA